MAETDFIQKDINYSLKNIPIPNETSYMKTLIDKTANFVNRLRWVAIFFLKEKNDDDEDDDEEQTQPKPTYGFNSEKSPGKVKELTSFENDLWKLINSVKFTNHRCEFQKKLKNDITEVTKTRKLIITADKTRNLYQVEPETHKTLLQNNVTRRYTKTNQETTQKINHEAKLVAEHLEINERIECIAETPAFITLKDHKPDFQANPQVRLINGAKSEIGKITQQILSKINATIRDRTGLMQWRNTAAVTKWFKELKDKPKLEFMQLDIIDFYPSITPKLLEKALEFAQEHTFISDKELELLNNARKTILFTEDSPWTKTNGTFDVSMGSYDGAEVAELVGLLILNEMNSRFHNLSFGLYRDDGLAVYEEETTSANQIENMKTEIKELFNSHGLQITIEFYLSKVNYLDVTLDLPENTFEPYRKPNDHPLYIHTMSNHPPNIIKELPDMIQNRLNNISSNKQVFDNAAPMYNKALRHSGYNTEVKYKNPENTTKHKRQRKRKITYYNPPFNKAVTTSIGTQFLKLLDKHFPKNRQDNLQKVINRQTVKISYSTTPNVKRIFTAHNAKVIGDNKTQEQKKAKAKDCNCRKKDECPLDGKCQQEALIYKATASTGSEPEKTYYGSTEGTFKRRYYSHKQDLAKITKRGNTTLAAYVWDCRDRGLNPTVKWEIFRKAKPYKRGQRRCDVCITEKLTILQNTGPNCLNQRSELCSKCPHSYKHKLERVKPP